MTAAYIFFCLGPSFYTLLSCVFVLVSLDFLTAVHACCCWSRLSLLLWLLGRVGDLDSRTEHQ